MLANKMGNHEIYEELQTKLLLRLFPLVSQKRNICSTLRRKYGLAFIILCNKIFYCGFWSKNHAHVQKKVLLFLCVTMVLLYVIFSLY